MQTCLLYTSKEVSGPYGMETTCAPMEGADLELQLQEAVKHIKGSMAPAVDAVSYTHLEASVWCETS